MIVAPDRLFRDGLRRLLSRADRVVVDSCETLDEVGAALQVVPPPDLFVVGIGVTRQTDLVQTDTTGSGVTRCETSFAQLRELRARVPSAAWIALSRRNDLAFLREAIDTGLEGLLLYDSPGEVLQLSTELVLLGHSFVPAEVARMMSGAAPLAKAAETWTIQPERFASAAPASAGPVYSGPAYSGHAACPEEAVRGTVHERPVIDDPSRRRQISLSDRENEILHCLVAGYSNKLIARELQIAEATVKVHVKGLLRKMQVANRTQAAISALKLLNASGDAAKLAASLTPGATQAAALLPM